jgi:hypothetical protein
MKYCVAVLCLATASIHAQPRLDVRFQPARPSLSDTIELEVSMRGLSASEAALLPIDIASDCVAILDVRDDGNRRILTLDPLKPGPCHIPAFQTRCLGAATNCAVQSAETSIPISTEVTTNDIRDTEEEPIDLNQTAFNGERAWWLSLLLIPIVAALWYIRRRRAQRAAERRAERRLRKLAHQTEAYDIFRDYLDERLSIGARTRSAPELLSALQDHDLCKGWVADELNCFLNASDHDKFSRAPVMEGDARETCRTLVQIIHFELTRRSRARV